MGQRYSSSGFKVIVLTAKHHDGFCNRQTKTTDFCVKSSPWKNGKGDVVKELADTCHRTGMWFGLYLLAYDVHYQKSGLDKKAYSQSYGTQLTELCTNCGIVDELWFDGMGANEMLVNWRDITAIIRSINPTRSFSTTWFLTCRVLMCVGRAMSEVTPEHQTRAFSQPRTKI